jgi:hypothetical protein
MVKSESNKDAYVYGIAFHNDVAAYFRRHFSTLFPSAELLSDDSNVKFTTGTAIHAATRVARLIAAKCREYEVLVRGEVTAVGVEHTLHFNGHEYKPDFYAIFGRGALALVLDIKTGSCWTKSPKEVEEKLVSYECAVKGVHGEMSSIAGVVALYPKIDIVHLRQLKASDVSTCTDKLTCVSDEFVRVRRERIKLIREYYAAVRMQMKLKYPGIKETVRGTPDSSLFETVPKDVSTESKMLAKLTVKACLSVGKKVNVDAVKLYQGKAAGRMYTSFEDGIVAVYEGVKAVLVVLLVPKGEFNQASFVRAFHDVLPCNRRLFTRYFGAAIFMDSYEMLGVVEYCQKFEPVLSDISPLACVGGGTCQ